MENETANNRTVTRRTRPGGGFFCPSEGVDRSYRLVDLVTHRRVLGLRLGQVGETLTELICDSCETTYDAGVLALPTASQMADQLSAFFCLATAEVVRAAGANDAVRERAVTVLERRVPDFTEARLDAELAHPDADRLELLSARVAGFLTPTGIRSTLATFIDVAGSGDAIAPEVLVILIELGEALGLGYAETCDVLARAVGDVDLR